MERFLNHSYDTKKRLFSYWHQMDEIEKTQPESVLEIGIGSGFLKKYLDGKYKYHTLDIAQDLHPDCVGSVLHLPFLSQSFSVVLCCEVLEHLSFDLFPSSLQELRRVARKRIILSLPDRRPFLSLQLPLLGKQAIYSPFFTPPHTVSIREHQWEVNTRKVSLQDIIVCFEQARLKLIRTYQVFENYKHRFFILET